MEEAIRTIVIRDKRKLPVDVCDDNKRLLESTAQEWVEELLEECELLALDYRFKYFMLSVNSDLDEKKSVALLTVELEGRVKNRAVGGRRHLGKRR